MPAQRRVIWQSVPRAELTGRGGASGMGSDRQSDIDEFYRILDQLSATMGGPRRLRALVAATARVAAGAEERG
jgi:hypothetical protein